MEVSHWGISPNPGDMVEIVMLIKHLQFPSCLTFELGYMTNSGEEEMMFFTSKPK